MRDENRNSFSKKILDYLYVHSGKVLHINKIKKDLLSKDSNKAKNRAKKFSIPRDKYSESKRDLFLSKLKEHLEGLSELGLIKPNKSYYSVKKPFLLEAEMSISRSGFAFGVGNFSQDIFIPASKRMKVNQRDKVLIRLLAKTKKRYEGEVFEMVEPFTNIFVAKILEKKKDDHYLLSLIDLPDQPMAILPSKMQLRVNSYLVVKLEKGRSKRSSIPSTQKNGRIPFRNLSVCSFVENISQQDEYSYFKRICIKYKLPSPYSKNQEDSTKKLRKKLEEGFKDKKRKDLTKLYTCTIDGENVKDFDDAISIERSKKITKLYVHIADVSYFVELNSEIDKEAFSRGNSYYLGQSVIHMLPPILSEDYCSLKPESKRLAFTCEIHFNRSGEMLFSDFYKSIIFVDQRLTYQEAEKQIKNQYSRLALFYKLASTLKKRRLNKGGIDLEIPDLELVMDKHNKIVGIRNYKRLQSHQLIEEFMLAANIATAVFSKKNKIPNIYRTHDPMESNKIHTINSILHAWGNKTYLNDTQYSSIQNVLASLNDKKVTLVINYLILRSFMKAVYSNKPTGHWGLGIPDYTHFTSPIRRYSDLVVHRQINCFINKEKNFHQNQDLKMVSEQISDKERLAIEAERDILKMISIKFMQKEINRSKIAFLTGFNAEGLFIILDDFPIDGFVPLNSFSDSKELVKLNESRLVLPRFQRTVPLGIKLKVKLIKCDWDRIRLIFNIEKICN